MPQYNNPISSKLPQTGTSIFTIMSKLATEHEAINLSQGFPDFAIDVKLVKLVVKHLKGGKNQYAPMQGIPELRQAIAKKFETCYKASYDADTEINVVSGATQGLYTAMSAFIEEGDEVILFTPAYDSYAPGVILHGGLPKYVELRAPDYSIPWDQVKKLVSQRTRMIIINSPHNPTGKTLSKEDMLELEKITSNSEILVLSDEVYDHILFDGKKHQSACLFPGLAERSFIVGSFGKIFHVTGWKMGYVLAPANLMAEFRKAHQYQVFTSNSFLQYALAEFLSVKNNFLALAKFYEEKRDYFVNGLKGSRFKVLPAEGTYFQLLDYSAISDKADVDMARDLTIEKKIASIPVSVFYQNKIDDNVLRFCFAKKKETLDKALEILQKI
ncbi:MAG: methionine aminotransferase [Flavobacteriales bacterium]